MRWIAAFAAVLLLAAAFPLGAQTVRGHVVAEARPAGEPIAGAWVALTDSAGAVAASGLTDAGGAFSLRAPTQGTFWVRAEVSGFEVSGYRVRVGPDGAEADVSIAPLTLALPEGERRVDKQCRLEPADMEVVAAAWAEARKAFRSVVLSQERAIVQFETETWFRELDPRRLRVRDEGHTQRPGFHPTARVPSPPPEELAAEGYVRGGEPGEGLSFFGPDARTLLSDSFMENHCLGFDDDGPEDGWVGLTFRPLDERARDVEGTLWIDADSYEPQRIDFRFTVLPWPVKADKTGGTIEFRRLAGGPLIVHRWWTRMPRVEMRSTRITPWDPPRDRYTLSVLVEEGGRVTRVQMQDGTIEEMR